MFTLWDTHAIKRSSVGYHFEQVLGRILNTDCAGKDGEW